MPKNFKFYVLVFSSSLLVLSLLSVKEAGAQTFSLTPSTATQSAGVEFNVDLNINTGGKTVTAADVKITFDSTLLQITKIIDGTFFSETSHNLYSGTLYVGGSETEGASGSGKLATLTLKGKAAGTTALAFACSSQTSDSNIFDNSATPKDIINCAGTKNGSYTLTGSSTGLGGGGVTETEETPTPEPPVTGISWPTVFSFGLGAGLFILGLVFVF